MAEYAKPWLSVHEQIDRLAAHGVEIEDRVRAASVLQAVGYYRLTGYLYPCGYACWSWTASSA